MDWVSQLPSLSNVVPHSSDVPFTSPYRKLLCELRLWQRHQMFSWKSQNGTKEHQILSTTEKTVFIFDLFPLAFAPHVVFSLLFSRQTGFTKHPSERPTGCNPSLSFPALTTRDTRAYLTQNCPRVFMCWDLSSASSSLSIRLFPWTTAALFTRMVMSPTCKKKANYLWQTVSPLTNQQLPLELNSHYCPNNCPNKKNIAHCFHSFWPSCLWALHSFGSSHTGSWTLYNVIGVVTLLFYQYIFFLIKHWITESQNC